VNGIGELSRFEIHVIHVRIYVVEMRKIKKVFCVVGESAVDVHSKTCCAERDNTFAVINISDRVVYNFHIIAFINYKGTFLKRKKTSDLT